MGEETGRKAAVPVRCLVLVLSDQLDCRSAAFDEFDEARDAVWMAETPAELTRVPFHKARIVLLLSGMRRFRDLLRARGRRVLYRELDAPDNRGDLTAELIHAVRSTGARRLVVVRPGEWRLQQSLRDTARELGVELEVRPDRHFFCSVEQFTDYARQQKRPRVADFYREMRRRSGFLMDGDEPVGGRWCWDEAALDQAAAPEPPGPRRFPPDETTRRVMRLVRRRFADHPGELEQFDWPLTPRQAHTALSDFVNARLRDYGPSHNTMRSGQPFMFHSRLSPSLNLKLLDPRDVLRAAEKACSSGAAPVESAERFVRGILGWREFVRGVYWSQMPDYLHRNALDAHVPLPAFYWTGETPMNCLRRCIGQTLKFAYQHPAQRLMVTGQYALLLGVEPLQFHRWALAMHVDAVEWAALPNALGLSQFADGGRVEPGPRLADGARIERASDYCGPCRYEPGTEVGDEACPFTTLHRDFLMRHCRHLRLNSEMKAHLRRLAQLPREERTPIRRAAEGLRASSANHGGA